MAGIVIADTGPLLVFLCCNRQNLLAEVLHAHFDEIIVHEAVDIEVRRKTSQTRFARGARGWAWLVDAGHIRVVGQEASDLDQAEMRRHFMRLRLAPYESWTSTSKDVGETMSTALAHVHLDAGRTVALYVDDADGQRLAGKPRPDGLQISIIDTELLLRLAVRLGLISDRAEMRSLWQQFRTFDDGFPGIEATSLLSREVWSTVPRRIDSVST